MLEPSPPAVTEPPWFADDPAAVSGSLGGRPVVTPTTAGDITWSELCSDEPELSSWCATRWLAAWPPLSLPPEGWQRSRVSLHVLAEHVLAPARHAATGKIGLRWTRGGFGTPFFGTDRQVRVEGTEVIVVDAGSERRAPIETVRKAHELVGAELRAPADLYTPSTKLDLDATLDVDGAAAELIGNWFGFATSALEQVRAEATTDDEASRVQLWPEHFDISVELGSEHEHVRAGYGASPGDEAHPEPYFYVVPWEQPPDNSDWNDHTFAGASLALSELVRARDQRAAALRFFRQRRDALLER